MQSEEHLSGQITVQMLLYKDGTVGKNWTTTGHHAET